MADADKVSILNRTGPGSTPQEPLALVAKITDSERSALESERRGGLSTSTSAESDTNLKPPEIRYLYYQLYANDEIDVLSKVAFDPEEPSLGRIQADFVAPPLSPASVKRCISRVEKTAALAHADLFADISCDTPLKEGHISMLSTDGPGLSRNEPMAIVKMPIVQANVHVESPSIPDGRYLIKNRASDLFWNVPWRELRYVCFLKITVAEVKQFNYEWAHWDITHDTNGNIFMTTPYATSSPRWVGVDISTTGSTVPVPWRLIPVDGKFYYLTSDINRVSQNPLVPSAALYKPGIINTAGSMVTLKEGDQQQMWEFIRI